MAAFVAFALFSPYFTLKKITVVRDNPNLDASQIEKSLEDFYDKNLFFLPRDQILKKLRSDFAEFREIEISEKWPDGIELKISVSPPFANLLNTETANFSVISEDGVILAESSRKNLPTIKIFQRKKPISPREKFLKKTTLLRIEKSQNFIKNQLKLRLAETRYLTAAREIHLVTEDGAVIWIDAQIEVDPQLRKLELAADEIGLYSKKFEHIDLRIPEQIFWKEL